MTQANVLAASGSAGVSQGFKNRIINGAMMIDQRNAGASVTASSTAAVVYTLDRWSYIASQASKFTVQQNAGSVTPPIGFTNYLGITSSSAYTVNSTDYFIIQQNIEGLNISDLAWGTANAKTVTLSFWVYSSLTGTFGGALQNSSSNRSYPFSYTVSSANTWTQVSVTIAGDTTGTWLTTNGIGIKLRFSLGMGSTVSNTANTWTAGDYDSATGATSVVGTNGATFYITGVQLEVGASATNFEVRDYGRELMMCQRYYYTLGGTASYEMIGTGTASNTNSILIVSQLPVKMRSAPTLTTAGSFLAKSNGSNVSVSSISTDQAGTQTFSISATATASTGQGIVMFASNDLTARFNFSSEL